MPPLSVLVEDSEAVAQHRLDDGSVDAMQCVSCHVRDHMRVSTAVAARTISSTTIAAGRHPEGGDLREKDAASDHRLPASSVRVAVEPGQSGRAGYGCPPAFDLGGLTLPETLTLPRIQAGLAAGAYTLEDHIAVFNSVDHNDNGVICFQDVGALTGGASSWQYFYNVVDDNASVPDS
jgi:hypothetical protein